MKNFIKLFIILGLTITTVSCDSSARVREVTVYRAPDGVLYRRGEIYTTVKGDVYQNGVLIRRGTTVIIEEPNLPTGQLKKYMAPNLPKNLLRAKTKRNSKKKRESVEINYFLKSAIADFFIVLFLHFG